MRTLIADDDAGMRLVLRKAVEKYPGFVIVGEAEDGGSALKLFEELRPEVVFLDVEMPVMNGVECAKKCPTSIPKPFLYLRRPTKSICLKLFRYMPLITC